MKIHGPNQTNFNPYKNHMQKQTEYMKDFQKKDQLEISAQAKKLLADTGPNTNRVKDVEEIKQAIDKGTYRVNHEQAAEKMIQFWSKRS